MSISYKDLVFESNKTDNYMMDLCMLPEGVNLRCNDIKRFVIRQPNSKFVYFPLSREFDIHYDAIAKIFGTSSPLVAANENISFANSYHEIWLFPQK